METGYQTAIFASAVTVKQSILIFELQYKLQH
jgi:hypothetical protein